MKKYLLLSVLVILFACSDDESCGENGTANGECLSVFTNYFTVANGTEYLDITFGFGPGAPRYSFTVRADNFEGQSTSDSNTELEVGRNYISSSMTFNGDFNTPGSVVTTFSKIDRDTGLVSGSFEWAQDATDFVEADSFNGTFSDAEVDFR